MYLNFKQRRYLRKTKKGITYTVQTYDPIARHLYKEELVNITECDKPGDYMMNIKITEKGKAYLAEHFDTNVRANIALMLSVLSLLISFGSLVVSVISSL